MLNTLWWFFAARPMSQYILHHLQKNAG